MLKVRVIPCLLLRGKGLYKTKKFKDPVYIGDPVNAVRIFNEKEVDELIFLDIAASLEGNGPNFELLTDISGEAFMPLAYGGGVTTLAEMEKIFKLGFEKIILNTSLFKNESLVKEAVSNFGSQSIVASVDVRKSFWGKYEVFCKSGTQKVDYSPLEACDHAQVLGVGEIFLNSIDCDGLMTGMDISLIKSVSPSVDVPLVACGGAGSLGHLQEAIAVGGASSVAAGSFFVFHGKHRAVLITYPSQKEIEEVFPV